MQENKQVSSKLLSTAKPIHCSPELESYYSSPEAPLQHAVFCDVDKD